VPFVAQPTDGPTKRNRDEYTMNEDAEAEPQRLAIDMLDDLLSLSSNNSDFTVIHFIAALEATTLTNLYVHFTTFKPTPESDRRVV
jgi:hypothetical protein